MIFNSRRKGRRSGRTQMQGVLGTKLQLTVALLCIVSCSSACRTQPKAHWPDDPIVADVLGKRIRLSQEDQLNGIILGALLEEHAKEHKIEPSRPEIDAFVAYGNKVEQQLKENQRDKIEIIGEIIGKLNAIAKTADDDETIDSQYLEMMNRMLEANLEMVESRNEITRQQQDEMLKRLDKQMAEKSILQWKVNLSLFNQYGGRVVFQQAGPEPVDAYRDFLQEHEKRGSFHILDKNLAREFWDYFVNDDMHLFISETREEGLEILNTPWWHMEGE